VIVSATLDGTQSRRKERAFTRAGSSPPVVTATIEATADALVPVVDSDRRDRHAAGARRTCDRHDPDDAV
jgi:hypothetical protein